MEILPNKLKGLEVTKEDQIAHMPLWLIGIIINNIIVLLLIIIIMLFIKEKVITIHRELISINSMKNFLRSSKTG